MKKPDRTPQDATSISTGHLQTDFVALPSDLAYWGERAAEALGKRLRARALRKRLFAEKFLELKQTVVAGTGKSPSEKVCEEMVELDDLYKKAVDVEIDTIVECARLDAVVSAIGAKRDSLTHLGARERDERAAELHIQGKEYDRQAAANQDDD